MLVQVPERGSAEIAKGVFERLAASPAFWGLVERGIVAITLRPNGGAQLSGGAFVGRAVCGDVTLEIVEKIPGALEALLGYASGTALRIERLPGSRTELGPLVAHLAAAYLEEARRYLSRGREFDYVWQRDRGPLAGGRLSMSGTALLRARGLPHLIAFDRREVSYANDTNLVVQCALRELELIATLVGLDDAALAEARALGMFFEPAVVLQTRASLAELADSLAMRDQANHDLLALAALLLRHESFEQDQPLGPKTPRSWFLNLERLFEDAILREINRLGFAGLTAQHGSRLGRSYLRSPHYGRADPDIVLIQDSLTAGVGDAKYKEWSRQPARSDIYQLLVHAAAFDAQVAFLVYPNDRFEVTEVGESVTGCSVHSFGIDLTTLSAGVEAMLHELDAPSTS